MHYDDCFVGFCWLNYANEPRETIEPARAVVGADQFRSPLIPKCSTAAAFAATAAYRRLDLFDCFTFVPISCSFNSYLPALLCFLACPNQARRPVIISGNNNHWRLYGDRPATGSQRATSLGRSSEVDVRAILCWHWSLISPQSARIDYLSALLLAASRAKLAPLLSVVP